MNREHALADPAQLTTTPTTSRPLNQVSGESPKGGKGFFASRHKGKRRGQAQGCNLPGEALRCHCANPRISDPGKHRFLTGSKVNLTATTCEVFSGLETDPARKLATFFSKLAAKAG
jgi:hypothetical protein